MPGRAQEDTSTIEQLYAAAFFREALAALDRSALTSGTDTLEAAESIEMYSMPLASSRR
jgi:hypothetical protein